jgi:hypothetical protein
MACETECEFESIGLVAVDRDSSTGKLVHNSLEQCMVCKEIRLNPDY